MGFTELNVTIIRLYWNLWHKLLPNPAVNAFGFKIFHQETGFIKNLHVTESQASFFLLCLWFSTSFRGWDTTNFYTSTSAMGGTIVPDLQSSSCVHCQLFPTHSNGPVAQPFSTGVRNQPPETTLAEANRGTCLH